MSHIADNDPLEDAPLLRSIRHEEPFVVPSGFFERFPHLVQERIQRPRPGPMQRIRLALVRPAVAWASIVLVLGVLSWVIARSPGTPRTPVGSAQEPDLDIAPEELFLAEAAEMDLMEDLYPRNALLTEVGTGLSTAELAAYLEQDELPLELLIEEL